MKKLQVMMLTGFLCCSPGLLAAAQSGGDTALEPGLWRLTKSESVGSNPAVREQVEICVTKGNATKSLTDFATGIETSHTCKAQIPDWSKGRAVGHLRCKRSNSETVSVELTVDATPTEFMSRMSGQLEAADNTSPLASKTFAKRIGPC